MGLNRPTSPGIWEAVESMAHRSGTVFPMAPLMGTQSGEGETFFFVHRLGFGFIKTVGGSWMARGWSHS